MWRNIRNYEILELDFDAELDGCIIRAPPVLSKKVCESPEFKLPTELLAGFDSDGSVLAARTKVPLTIDSYFSFLTYRELPKILIKDHSIPNTLIRFHLSFISLRSTPCSSLVMRCFITSGVPWRHFLLIKIEETSCVRDNLINTCLVLSELYLPNRTQSRI